MIISASRRTDIPAFYSQWLLNRIRQGQVVVRHPRNPRQATQLSLAPEAVDAFVFWTKHALPLLNQLDEIDRYGHRYCFQYTLTPYGPDLEPRVPTLPARVAAFRALADRIGPERVLWRYDPVLFTPHFSPAQHLRSFAFLAGQLHRHTRRCTISLLTLYPKCRRALHRTPLTWPGEDELIVFAGELAAIAQAHDLALFACCDPFLTERCGVEPSRCIDPYLVGSMLGRPVTAGRKNGQRPGCGCAASVDIGAYDSCPHGCRYCYANGDANTVARQVAAHDPASPLLIGHPRGDERIRISPERSRGPWQRSLF